MKSLRNRLIITHILPLLIILPLLGLALIYILETQVLLANLSEEMTRQAAFTARLADDQPAIWRNAAQAQVFITQVDINNQTELRLLDPTGKLVASNDPEDTDQIGQTLEQPNLSISLAGNNSVQVNYTLDLTAEVVEVLVPVTGPNQEVVGVVELARELSSINDQFVRLRYFVIGMVAVALLAAVILGFLLALNIARPIRQVTTAIYDVAGGREWRTLPEQGPAETRLLLRAFNTLIERLRTLEEARRRLLANLVHEVGRPIGALQSAIQALLGGADLDRQFRQELLQGMEAEVNRLHPLLENLTKLYDKVLGDLELNRQPTDLNAWLAQTARPWREAAQAKNLRWDASIPTALPSLEIDPDRLAQVVGNLLSNAVKYTPAGGTISVSAGATADAVWMRVGDTGPGLNAEEQQRIFEPFYRSQPGRRFPQGMGLGLTIAQDLVVAHGGRLAVASSPAQGSQFTIWLPRENAGPEPDRLEENNPKGSLEGNGL